MIKHWRAWLPLIFITLLGLWLRLLALDWSEFRPLGGDEQEYYDLALSIARREGYYELQFMRPPLFPFGMAVIMSLFGSDLQTLRLFNVLLSTATIPAMWWLVRGLFPSADRRIPLVAALGTALWYTLALNATELLTETVTLLGLVLWFGCLFRASSGRWWWPPLLAILVVLICLTRSVALPLIPLGVWWLWLNLPHSQRLKYSAVYLGLTLVLLAPWAIRNTITYGGFILIDTTGPENLWLDNDPAGREAVKAQLYALGNDRVARSELASERGMAVIFEHPGWVAAKSWREFQRFWALEQIDDLYARPAIWVSPAETWARVLLGDGLWLALLTFGFIGLVLAPLNRSTRVLLLAWLAYIIFTNALFHVEFRYRLPIVPALAPLAAWGWIAVLQGVRHPRRKTEVIRESWQRGKLSFLALALGLGLLGVAILSHGYTTLVPDLARKHLALWQAEQALEDAQDEGLPAPNFPNEVAGSLEPVYLAQAYAATALQADPDSILARVIQARAELLLNNPERAEVLLRESIALLPAHPYPHLVLGDLLRSQGEAARAEFAYETASREDLQRWAWFRLTETPTPARLDFGAGNDLGFIQGFYPPEPTATTRWIGEQARFRLSAIQPPTTLRFRVRAPVPPAIGRVQQLTISIQDQPVTTLEVGPTWQELEIPWPAEWSAPGVYTITLQPSVTWVPYDLDRFNPDGRELALELDWAELQ